MSALPAEQSPYQLLISGLDADIAATPVTPAHKELLRTLKRVSALQDAVLATQRDGTRLGRHQVLSTDGSVVARDLDQWLRAQCEEDGGDASKTWLRLKDLGYLVTECEVTRLYFVCDRGTANQAAFLQVEVFVEQWVVCEELFGRETWARPRDLDDLVHGRSSSARAVESRPLGAPLYRLRQVIDVAAFVRIAGELDRQRRARDGRRAVVVNSPGAAPRSTTLAQLHPEMLTATWPGQRLFDDWTLSSAGRSGARLCASWVMQISDWTSPEGERFMSLIPAWTFPRRLAEVKRASSNYELYGKLQKIDQRTGVPFAWYFYALHGNRVQEWAIHCVLGSAEQGLIVLPEHDYRVLKRYQEAPYGF